MSTMLLLAHGTGATRRSVPIEWQAGYGTLSARGLVSGTGTLYFLAASTAPTAGDIAEEDSYHALGGDDPAEISAAAPDNLFYAPTGYLYVEVEGEDAETEYSVGIHRQAAFAQDQLGIRTAASQEAS